MTYPRTLLCFLAFMFFLAARGDAQTPTVTTSAATGVTDLAAILRGSANANGGTLNVYFDYGTTISYGSTIYASSLYGGTTVNVSASPSGLLPNTTYHFRIKGVDGSNFTYYGADMAFTTALAATPPTVGTVSTTISAQAARLQVSSVSAGSSPATVFFEYGLTTAYGSTATYFAGIDTNTTSYSPSVIVAGLAPSTLYHFRCKATNAQGTTYSADGTFTTLALPVLTTTPATGVIDIAATFNGNVNPNGATLTVYFQYGLDIGYGSSAYPYPSNVSGNTTVTTTAAPVLLPNTTYHYRLVGYDGNNNYYYGNDASFTTTPPSSRPSLSTGTASPVGATSATIAANNVSAGSSPANLFFDYGTTSSYGSQVEYPYPVQLNTIYSTETVTLSGLAPGTTYHYRARAVNSQGTTVGADATFTTRLLPTVTTGSATGISDLAATLNGTANANNGSYQVAYEYGPTIAYGSSVNATPASVTGSSSLSFTANPPALLPNTTYHYRLRLSDDITSYYGADATFTTLAPGTPPTATTAAASAITATTAVLNANTVASGSSPTSIVFDYGTTTAYGSTMPYVTEMTNQSYSTVKALVTGLQPLTTYHFRVRATNAQGSVAGADMTFTTLGLPTVTTTAATNVTDIGASLNSTVNPAGVSSTVSFEYGPTTSYGSSIKVTSSPAAGTNPVGVSASISGSLQPQTTCHYRVRLDNIDGTYYGADSVFSTAAPGTPPSIGSQGVYNLGVNGATLYAYTVNAGSSPTTITFEYGPTSSYGQQVIYPSNVPARTTLDATVTLSGLQPNTTYHFRARATNSEGTAYGAESVFTTVGLPSVTTGPASSITDTTAVLSGNAMVNGGSLNTSFQYGTTTAYGSTLSTNPSSLSGYGSSSVLVAGAGKLLPNTTYHYRLKGTTNAGEAFYGADQTFVTASPSTLPSISTDAPSVQATSATLTARNIAAGGSPATVSWDYGLTTSYGSSKVYPATIPTGTNYGTAAINITGLSPATTYHYRAVIINAQATVYGADVMFTTPPVSVTATTLPATQIRSTGATLNGSYQTDVSGGTITFDYGLDTNYGLSANAVPSILTPNAASAPVAGLTPGTIYHYRFVNTTPSGTAYGADMTFTTLATGTPVAMTGTALASVSGPAGAATFRGIVNASGFTTTPVIEYGLTTNYGAVAYASPTPVSGTTDTAVSATVLGLSQYVTYHYRLVATNAQGTTYGDDATVQIVQPAMAVTGAAYPSSTDATLYGNILNSPPYSFVSNAYFEYGLTADYGSAVSLPYFLLSINGGSSVSTMVGLPYFNVNSPPLQPNTTYHYRFVVVSTGGTSYGSDATFTTDFASPTLAYQPVSGLTSSGVTLNATVTEAGATDSVSFDYGLDNSYGATMVATPATVSGTGTTPVNLSLSGLTPGATYHYRIWTSRSIGNGTRTFRQTDQTFTTLTLVENWKQQNFGTSANSGATADGASFSGDGVANLLKYALGLDPTVANAALLPPGTPKNYGGATYLSYTFPRDPTKTDLTYEVVVADSLSGPWTPIASSSAGAPTTGPGFVSETPTAGGIMSVEVHDTVSTASAGQRFLRLRVTH